MLTKPIKTLHESAEIVRAGNLRHRASVAKTGDEIEELGHAFNAMTASLEERQRWMEEEKEARGPARKSAGRRADDARAAGGDH